MKKRIAALSLILSGTLLLSACDKVKSIIPTEPQTISAILVQGGNQVVPKNVIQIGETFEYYPDKATGHFLCAITGARVVTKETDCPPLDKFFFDVLASYGEDGETIHKYDDWFTEDGAMARGCMLVLVDLTVTNVDAEAAIDHGLGSSSADRGYFLDPYAFVSTMFGSVVNTTEYSIYNDLEGKEQYDFDRYNAIYFSRMGEFSATNLQDSLGYDPGAIKVLPGETVSFTLGCPVDTNYDGTSKPLSKMMFCATDEPHYERGIFVDLKLGEETPNQE